MLSRGRAPAQVISRALQGISRAIRRQVCLGVRPGCLERFKLFRGRLKSSRAARLSRAASGYLESTSGYLEPLVQVETRSGFYLEAASSYLEPPQDISSGLRGYLERSGQLGRRDGSVRDLWNCASDRRVTVDNATKY